MSCVHLIRAAVQEVPVYSVMISSFCLVLCYFQEANVDSDDEDDEDYGLADTYANYMPSKCKWNNSSLQTEILHINFVVSY